MLQPLLPVLVLLGAIAVVVGNYQCLCSYHVERGMYQQPSAVSAKLGHMYEFDCQPLVTSVTSPPGWAAIAYKHQVGYVEVDQNAVTTVCQGTYPAADWPTTTTTTTPTTKATPTTSTPTTTTTTTTPTTTKTPTTYTPTTTTTTTTTPPTTTQRHVISGNTSLCPAILHQYAREDKAALTQYDESCYELVPIRTIWYKAENDCRAKGGHLFHISNQAEQDFIYQKIKSLIRFDHAVWTGLHDLANEEYFEWISGDHVIYTNWYADRLGNMASHHLEDCVLFVPYAPYFGKWDDVVCGTETIFGTNVGQQNPFICQYPIHPQPQRVTGLPLVGKRLAT